jgi:hypothetical protein
MVLPHEALRKPSWVLVGMSIAIGAQQRAAELAEPVGRSLLGRASYGVSLVG